MKRLLVGLAAACVLVLPACGNDSSDTPTTTPSPATTTTTTAPTTTAAPAPLTTTAPSVPVAPTQPPAQPPAQPQGPVGADGSTGNNLSPEYCARNEDPGCPAGSFVHPNAIPNPNGDGSFVPCEGTICTNPDHGAGVDPQDNGGAVMPNPNGDGSEVPCEGTICTNPNSGGGE